MKTPENKPFELVSSFTPAGDQVRAIPELISNINSDIRYQTLQGITGSGKTFTIANVIKSIQRPTLVIAPNKTLAAQLYNEFKEFFPNNRVRYFVSYYDYYQPEAYIPSTDTYIEKDSAINEEIDKMRHAATKALLEGRDTIIVASVSCIYGLGAPDEYFKMMLYVEQGDSLAREDVIKKLVKMQYGRGEVEFKRGTFRVRGETIDIFPSDQDAKAVRLLFFGDEIEEITEIDGLSGDKIQKLSRVAVYPVSHYVTGEEVVTKARRTILLELKEQLANLQREGKLLEAQRLEQRTLYDCELMQELGFCSGIENYSRHMDGRAPGTPPTTLIDYFPKDFLLVIDESHITLPQLGGMYRGDRARKTTLVNYGFRLPSALDNRPLTDEEFWQRVGQCIFVSATPGDRELQLSQGLVIEQINRPTGLLDPEVIIRPATHQVDDLLQEVREVVKKKERVLVTTLTKKMAEDLSKYFQEIGVKAKYLHSDIDTIERVEILRGLRRGDFDVLIGINLLREGLDLVEVSLVAILDADKEGFLRSARSLIQTMGRAARNINGKAILYADKMTDSIKLAVSEANRRRKIQHEYNQKHGITPVSAKRSIDAGLNEQQAGSAQNDDFNQKVAQLVESLNIPKDPKDQKKLVESLRKEMFQAAASREFEKAAMLRDKIKTIQELLLT